MPRHADGEAAEMGTSRVRNVSVKSHGGRFGGPNEQRAASKGGRGQARKSAPRLTIDDYDRAKV